MRCCARSVGATLSGSALALEHGPWALPTATLCIPFGNSLCRIRNESRRSRMRTALQSFEQERCLLPIFFRNSRFLVATLLGMAGWGFVPIGTAQTDFHVVGFCEGKFKRRLKTT